MSKKSIMSRLLTAALAAFTALPMLTVSAYAEEGSSGEGGGLIREVSVELDASGFKYGSAPVMIASVPDGAHYSVLFERWSEPGQDTEDPAAVWYSDESLYAADDTRISTFEKGKQYSYDLSLQAEDGYTFVNPDEINFTYNGREYHGALWLNGDGRAQLTAVDMSVVQIDSISIINAILSYKAGDAPAASAVAELPEGESAFYKIDEYWEQLESDDNGEMIPVRFWHSDEEENAKVPEDKRLTTFEKGKTYMYSLHLRAVSGYCFSDDCTLTLNGETVDFVSVYESTLFATAIKTIRPTAQNVIEIVRLDDLKVSYEPGEAPVPSATVSDADADKYEILWECWAKLEESDRGTMEEVAWWSSADSESTPIITEFEKGAEYSYSIWIKAKDGYEFGNDLTLILNGEECTYGYFGASLGGAQCFGDGIVRLHPGGELAGDINGDGSVNTADLVRLMKYIAGNDVIAHVPDVNGDGMVSVADLVRLMKFISGLDVELHPAYPKPETDTPNRPM